MDGISAVAFERATSLLEQLRRDGCARPSVFRWSGPCDRASVDEVVDGRRSRLSDELRGLWLARGSGELFESEEILSPSESRERADAYAVRGLVRPGVLFYEGSFGVAFAQSDGSVVTVSSSGNRDVVSESLLQWYRETLRREFAERYGLTLD